MCPHISIKSLFHRLVGWLVHPLVGDAFIKLEEITRFTDSGRNEQCRKEQGATRRKKEQRGRRSDNEEGVKTREERNEEKGKLFPSGINICLLAFLKSFVTKMSMSHTLQKNYSWFYAENVFLHH